MGTKYGITCAADCESGLYKRLCNYFTTDRENKDSDELLEDLQTLGIIDSIYLNLDASTSNKY